MQKWKCTICGYVHDESEDGLWDKLSGTWVCPLCKAEKSAFIVEGGEVAKKEVDHSLLDGENKELTPIEISAICSNLAKGCEKQYLPEQAVLFTKLAMAFKEKATPVEGDMSALLTRIDEDLSATYPLVESLAKEHHDRGALRAYTWSMKVSVILQSLLERYNQLGDKMLENTGVYVCTICGFIYIGNDLPEVCPICRVPKFKFEEMGGEYHA